MPNRNADQSTILRLTPALGKPWLWLTAGLIWCGVGVLLNTYAFEWFALVPIESSLLLGVVGVIIGVGFYMLIFAGFATKNISRIDGYRQERVCIFAFQRWTSYPLVLVMIGMGIFLRKYSPVPKPYLAPLYFGIGSSLFIAGLKYFWRLARSRDDRSSS
ncbi:MAG: hypothetical protein PVI78_03345 [Anaerolineales bacterium]|jgi:hypothetical protein